MASRLDKGPRPGGPVVQGFRGASFLIDGTALTAVLLTPQRAAPWSPPPLEALTAADLASLIDPARPPEFILLGTGPTTRFAPALAAKLDALGIGLDVMDSRAAARAWALLRAEERWIAAALMPL